MSPEIVVYGILYSIMGSFGLGYWMSNRQHEKKRKETEEWIELNGSKYFSSPDFPYTCYKTIKNDRWNSE